MKNPFNHENYPSNRIKRNSFPLSFQYNGTFEYGKIYPVGLIRVPNAGTYKIEPTLALNFMPTVFPVQTRQKAYLHFFYGRDRNFWNEYKDFVHGLKPNLVKPYLDESVTQARTGNLLDYLGVPTTIVGNYGNQTEVASYVLPESPSTLAISGKVKANSSATPDNTDLIDISEWYYSVGDQLPVAEDQGSSSHLRYGRAYIYDLNFTDTPDIKFNNVKVRFGLVSGSSFNYVNEFLLQDVTPSTLDSNQSEPRVAGFLPTGLELYRTIRLYQIDTDRNILGVYSCSLSDNGLCSFDVNFIKDSSYVLAVPFGLANYFYDADAEGGAQNTYSPRPFDFVLYAANYSFYDTISSVRDIDDTTSPYWRSGATTDLRERIKLNAIPCRMYETIYNLYYRNPQNNPYILNGVPEYNIFTPTLDGGVDNNLYQLRYRNWADDFLTTATQTPQQGIAPLVGLTDRGATITLTNEDGSITRYKTTLDDDGNLTGIETTDSSEPILTQALVDAVTYGISIEDIRNVNKMQKWLELNLRKGYQYKDVIEARWGISISYNELNLPEFIGGFTQEVSMQAVTQTANIDDSVTGQLGWQAGRMYCAKDGREITHYCDEAGYIMVLLSIAPMPNYSQLLPKHWFTRDLLEEYQPEFNHIGFQPITYKEVCPVQAYQESTETNNVLEQTFGYQRPWYEYMSMPDEVHGQFRTTLKDYLINRVFDVKPELSESFLLVDPEQINDVFNVTESDDKILGAINYNIIAKLPISEYATATIE